MFMRNNLHLSWDKVDSLQKTEVSCYVCFNLSRLCSSLLHADSALASLSHEPPYVIILSCEILAFGAVAATEEHM